jgi:hypothetical protein
LDHPCRKAREIARALDIDESTFRKHYLPELRRRWDLQNNRENGYRFPESDRPL